ncbi:MAG: DUF89 family protein [Lentisphaeria bacterium]|nr:DUF89 family protein [Lentisphaeria bacterium]
MKLQHDCYNCIFKMAFAISRQTGKDEKRQCSVLREMLNYLANNGDKVIPPEVTVNLHAIFERETGIADPYREIKIKSTALGLELLDEVREIVNASSNPLETAIKIAIGGNIIDYGVYPDFKLEDAKKEVLKVLDMEFDQAALDDLIKRIKSAKQIFYVLDNCGEAVLDRLVLEQLPCKVIVGVRGKPALNDVTRVEAEESGITDYEIVDTGCSASGILLDRMPDDFKDALYNSDLVITKGLGNYESLGDDFKEAPIYLLFRVKCPVVARYLNVPLNSVQTLGCNLK